MAWITDWEVPRAWKCDQPGVKSARNNREVLNFHGLKSKTGSFALTWAIPLLLSIIRRKGLILKRQNRTSRSFLGPEPGAFGHALPAG
jgi:hypothetical protein